MSAVEVLKPCVKDDLVLDAVCSTTSLGARAFTVSRLKNFNKLRWILPAAWREKLFMWWTDEDIVHVHNCGENCVSIKFSINEGNTARVAPGKWGHVPSSQWRKWTWNISWRFEPRQQPQLVSTFCWCPNPIIFTQQTIEEVYAIIY